MAGEVAIVSSIRVRLDVKTQTDSGFATVTVAADGVVITLNKPFIKLNTIQTTAEFDETNDPKAAWEYDQSTVNPTEFTAYLIAQAGPNVGDKITGDLAWSVEGIVGS